MPLMSKYLKTEGRKEGRKRGRKEEGEEERWMIECVGNSTSVKVDLM